MSQIDAKVIAHSISEAGKQVASIQVTAHRFILAEINTHRVLSRNYRSSRAVPTAKLIDEVATAPAMPVYWGKSQPGMQAEEELTGVELEAMKRQWGYAAYEAALRARIMLGRNGHKQIVNRVLEPYLYVHGIITSTEWDNFFKLRRDATAQPEFKALADAMYDVLQASQPNFLKEGAWHLPYVSSADADQFDAEICLGEYEEVLAGLRKISTARCARVTYKVFDEDRPSRLDEDIQLHDRLMAQGHWSPFEHACTPDGALRKEGPVKPWYDWYNSNEHGNFVGWRQYRRQIPEGCTP
jgi:thymidylate synthase ThyX